MSKIKNEYKIIFEQNNSIGKKIGVSHNTEYVDLQIGAGILIPSHSLDIPVTFYIVEGKAELKIERETLEVKKGDLIEVPAKADREWHNKTNDVLKLLVVKHLQ